MEDRIKKLYSWSIPIVIIAAIVYLSISFMNGDGIGDPKKYAVRFESLKFFFASVFVSLEKMSTPTSPINIVPETDSQVFTSTLASSPTPPKNTSPSENKSASSPVSPSSPPVYGTGNNGGMFTEIPVSSSTPPSSGPPDLSVQIIDTGILSIDNIFSHATSVELGQKGAVVFEVKNIGGNVSPEWIFTAKIPIPDHDYTSLTQSTLAPGETIRFTMGFSNLEHTATNTVSFSVDPNIRVSNDPDRNNNNASTTLFRHY